LCHPVTGMYDLRFIGKVDQYNLNFSTIVCINRARCVQAGEAIFNGQATPWPHLRFKARRNFYK